MRHYSGQIHTFVSGESFGIFLDFLEGAILDAFKDKNLIKIKKINWYQLHVFSDTLRGKNRLEAKGWWRVAQWRGVFIIFAVFGFVSFHNCIVIVPLLYLLSLLSNTRSLGGRWAPISVITPLRKIFSWQNLLTKLQMISNISENKDNIFDKGLCLSTSSFSW